MLKKILPWRSKKYREFVAGHPCVICGAMDGTVVPHHVRISGDGISQKPGEDRCIPLCFFCHDMVHRKGNVVFGINPIDIAMKFKQEWDDGKKGSGKM